MDGAMCGGVHPMPILPPLITFTTLTDPGHVRSASRSALDRWFLRLIRDERDLPFVFMTLRVSATLIPLGVALYLPFLPTWLWWSIAVVYLYVNNITFKGPFGLMLHSTMHRQFFKRLRMNHNLPCALAPFFGHHQVLRRRPLLVPQERLAGGSIRL